MSKEVNTQSQASEQKSADANVSKPIQLVISFDASKDNVERLLLLLRSYEVYAAFDFTPVLIGDSPEQAKDSVLTIPFDEGCSHDMMGALMTAIHSDLIEERFIFAPLYTYLNKPILMAHIEIPKVDVNTDTQYYSTKFPMMYKKQELLALCEKIQSTVLTPDASTLTDYFRMSLVPPMILDWPKDYILLPVVSANPDLRTVEHYLRFKAAIYIEQDSAFDLIKDKLSAYSHTLIKRGLEIQA